MQCQIFSILHYFISSSLKTKWILVFHPPPTIKTLIMSHLPWNLPLLTPSTISLSTLHRLFLTSRSPTKKKNSKTSNFWTTTLPLSLLQVKNSILHHQTNQSSSIPILNTLRARILPSKALCMQAIHQSTATLREVLMK